MPGRGPVAVFLALIVSAATAAITPIVPASALPPPGEPPLPEAPFTLLGSYSTGGGEAIAETAGPPTSGTRTRTARAATSPSERREG